MSLARVSKLGIEWVVMWMFQIGTEKKFVTITAGYRRAEGIVCPKFGEIIRGWNNQKNV